MKHVTIAAEYHISLLFRNHLNFLWGVALHRMMLLITTLKLYFIVSKTCRDSTYVRGIIPHTILYKLQGWAKYANLVVINMHF